MNVGPGAMGSASDENLLVVMTHEMLHALGFASYRFDKFMAADGTQFVPVKQTTIGSGAARKSVWLMTSPRVVEAAREFFNCPSLEGLELEEFNENGQPGSHWEERNLGTEIMTPVADYGYGAPLISKMTLALFHDMGIYFPNYAKARDAAYGRGQGCAFVTEPPVQRGDGYSCRALTGASMCAGDTVSYGGCVLSTFADCLPAWSRADPNDCHRGGGSAYRDFQAEPADWLKCGGSAARLQDAADQSVGPDARCFMSDVASRRDNSFST